MILVFIFVSVLLFCLPDLHSATTNNISIPICPESFNCPALPPFKYPFFNVTDTRCGLIWVNCTSIGGEIQFEGRSYEIVNKFADHNSDTLLILNRTFEQLVNNKSCEALMNNLTSPSPSPLLYSISIASNITLFKCVKNITSTQQTDAYFHPHDYNRYYACNDYNFYYNYLNGTVPSDLPRTCQVVQLPAILPNQPGLDVTNIFSLLSYFPSILFKMSPSCDDCYKNGNRCETIKGLANCSYVIKEKQGRGWTWIKILRNKPLRNYALYIYVYMCLNVFHFLVLVIAASVLILALSFAIFIIWRCCKGNPFSYVSSKNKSPELEDISLSCGVSVFSFKELEDATQNFDPSRELGDGGFGAVYYGKLQDGREVALISSMVAVDLNRSQDKISLANLALNRIQSGAIEELIDPVLGSDTNPEIMSMITSVAELAFRCLQYESEMRPTMNEVLDVLMDIQALGGTEVYDSTRHVQTVNVPLSETNDTVVLLKDYRPSPVSVTSEWQNVLDGRQWEPLNTFQVCPIGISKGSSLLSNLLHSATDRNSSIPICPVSFSCPGLAPFKYPFFNVTDTRFIAGSALILLLSTSVIFIIWRHCKLKDGREVAMKKLHEHNYNRVQQFRNEVEILTNLRHSNLVVLYGCTSRESRELLLFL
ncbi:hypothetical protein L1987_06502 [Smallanthus sonchifolius]|uniref:Uncharacterized protein n=1 Tax=Smallanthus sonchifolius TaxID=185202 RepID=A0ACB9JYB5_9ASTR|nr:hypothetical protein L1987_06502 [Smallanthus sonchifolius]